MCNNATREDNGVKINMNNLRSSRPAHQALRAFRKYQVGQEEEGIVTALIWLGVVITETVDSFKQITGGPAGWEACNNNSEMIFGLDERENIEGENADKVTERALVGVGKRN